MSLLDTFLLEAAPLAAEVEESVTNPHAPYYWSPPELRKFRRSVVFVAPRTDGARGAGTISDPFNGSTWRGPELPVTLQWSSGNPGVVTVDTGLVEHLLAAGDIVEIAGVTGAAADHFNWRFPVHSVTSATSFECLIASPDTGSGGPEGSGITCQKIVYPLDNVLKNLPPRSTVYLAAGIYETRGNTVGWRHQDGQRICGSGIESTILKLVLAGVSSGGGVISPADYLNAVSGFEVSDLTACANMANHPYDTPYATVTNTAVSASGRHIRLRRIRAVDFGTQEPAAECFALTTGGVHPFLPEAVDDVISECIVEHPSPNNVRETTCLGTCGPGPIPPYSRANVIRDCVLDGRYDGRFSSHYVGISILRPTTDSSAPPHTYEVTTRTPHLLDEVPNKQNVVIAGIWAGEQTPSANLNGVFRIRRVISPTVFEYVAKGPAETSIDYWNSGTVGVQFHGPGSNLCEGNRVYHVWLGANHDTWSAKDSIYRNNYYAHVCTGIFHRFGGVNPYPLVGSAISHDGATAWFTSFEPHGLNTGDYVTVRDALVEGSNQNAYNQSNVQVTRVDDYRFTYDLGMSDNDARFLPNATAAPLFRAIGGGWNIAVSIERDFADITLAIVTVPGSHGLADGTELEISGVVVNGDANTPFNGTYSGSSPALYKVIAVAGSQATFKYRMSGNPGSGVAPNYSPSFTKQGETTRRAGAVLTRDGNEARYTATTFHGLLPGQAVKISGARVAGASSNPFNGSFEVEAVPASPHIDGKPTSFTYRMGDVPAGNASGAPTADIP